MEDKPNIYFRADGDSNIGLGHIIRSIALAEILHNSYTCYFITKSTVPSLKEKILEVCLAIISPTNTVDIISEAHEIITKIIDDKDIVVIDGYQFKTSYQRVFKEKGCKVVCIDDIHTYHFVSDIVINPGGNIPISHYSSEPYTQVYTGFKYALLRKPFIEAATKKNPVRYEESNIFICLGGADPHNHTLNVLRKVEKQNESAKCYVVIGAANQYKNQLIKYSKTSSLDIKILTNLSAKEMVYYMRKSSTAITSPSTVSLEYLSVGGKLFLKQIAANQSANMKYFIENKIARDFDKNYGLTSLNEQLSNEKKDIISGKQPEYLKRIFRSLFIGVRKATSTDINLYFNWTNDPNVRKQSYSTDLITFEQHERWFHSKVNNSNTILYVFEINKRPIGQIRFEINNTIAIINYTVDSSERGKGYGESILRQGISKLRSSEKDISKICGYVKKDNTASIKAFQSIDAIQEEVSEFKNSYKFTIT